MNKYVILIGGNLGNRLSNLQKARLLIEKMAGSIIEFSSIYESKSWGFSCENDFLNQVLVVESNLIPIRALKIFQQIEIQLGRLPHTNEEYLSRTMDIDILFFNDSIVVTDYLIIPHPKIQDRLFSLLPLNEIMSQFIHPQLGLRISDILQNCNDKTPTKLYENR